MVVIEFYALYISGLMIMIKLTRLVLLALHIVICLKLRSCALFAFTNLIAELLGCRARSAAGSQRSLSISSNDACGDKPSIRSCSHRTKQPIHMPRLARALSYCAFLVVVGCLFGAFTHLYLAMCSGWKGRTSSMASSRCPPATTCDFVRPV